MAEKQNRVKYRTPKGVMVHPWLNRPDTKFKPEGEYRTKLRLSKEDAQPLLDTLEPLHAAAVKASKDAFAKDAKNKGKKWDRKIHPLYAELVDDDGEPTGEIEMAFKRRASGVSKKDGSKWEIKPDLFDAKGGKLDPDVKVYGGSLGKVSFTAIDYDKPIGVGLSLCLEAVQVIKVISGGRNASSYGFDDESGDADADTPADTDAGEPGSGSGSDEDEF